MALLVPRADPVTLPDSVAAEIAEYTGGWDTTDDEDMSLAAVVRYQLDAVDTKAANDRRRYKPGHRRHNTRPGVNFPYRGGQQYRWSTEDQTQAREDDEDRIQASLKRAFKARESAAPVPARIPEDSDEFSDVPSGTIF